MTYVVARLLLQRSLQTQFWHSYSTCTALYDRVSETHDHERTGRIGEGGRQGVENRAATKRETPARGPSRCPAAVKTSFRRAHPGRIYLLRRHGRLRNTSRSQLRGKLASSLLACFAFYDSRQIFTPRATRPLLQEREERTREGRESAHAHRQRKRRNTEHYPAVTRQTAT